ncbi:MAG TPA: C4-type zinc ribbon domain-containing protein [Acidimicrobiales bacterium]|nr:C4-type zinc ribbon domain-containing protein [Acidimicrobiales bacterium]
MADLSLDALLVVQDHDTSADQLRHRRASLPERLALAELDAARSRLEAEIADLAERAAELGRSQRRLEDEVATIEAKAADTDRTLYSGTVTAPKELQAMQHEVESLRRRASMLEDDLLEVMEAAEPVNAELASLEERRDQAVAESGRLRALIDEAEVEIDAELAVVVRQRDEAVSAVPAPLVGTYEKLRSHLGGVAVARLDAGRCTGCHLALPATELDAARKEPSGAVIYHEECGRILVRPDT